MHEYLDTLSWFNHHWPTSSKDAVYHATFGNKTGYAIAFETNGLRILFAIMRGQRGGVTKFLIITDPSQSIEVDQLLCCNCSIKTYDTMSAEDFDATVPESVCIQMEQWKNNLQLLKTVADITGFGKKSVDTLSGGRVSPR